MRKAERKSQSLGFGHCMSTDTTENETHPEPQVLERNVALSEV